MLSHCIVVDLDVAIKNVKAINVNKDTQQCVLFAMFSSYKIRVLNAAAKNMNVLTASCKGPEIVLLF